jgi:hypothetical protein
MCKVELNIKEINNNPDTNTFYYYQKSDDHYKVYYYVGDTPETHNEYRGNGKTLQEAFMDCIEEMTDDCIFLRGE